MALQIHCLVRLYFLDGGLFTIAIWKRARDFCGASFVRARIPFMGLHPHGLITLLVPSPGDHKSLESLCNLMDYILSSSSVDGILQARILEWIAMPSSRVSS